MTDTERKNNAAMLIRPFSIWLIVLERIIYECGYYNMPVQGAEQIILTFFRWLSQMGAPLLFLQMGYMIEDKDKEDRTCFIRDMILFVVMFAGLIVGGAVLRGGVKGLLNAETIASVHGNIRQFSFFCFYFITGAFLPVIHVFWTKSSLIVKKVALFFLFLSSVLNTVIPDGNAIDWLSVSYPLLYYFLGIVIHEKVQKLNRLLCIIGCLTVLVLMTAHTFFSMRGMPFIQSVFGNGKSCLNTLPLCLASAFLLLAFYQTKPIKREWLPLVSNIDNMAIPAGVLSLFVFSRILLSITLSKEETLHIHVTVLSQILIAFASVCGAWVFADAVLSWRKIRSLRMRSLTLPLCACLFPLVFLYVQNIYEAKFLNGIPVFIVYFIVSVILFGRVELFYKHPSKTAVITSTIMAMIMNCNLVIEYIYTKVSHPYYITWSICVIIFLLMAIIMNFITKSAADMVETGITVALIVMIAFNVVGGIPKWIDKNRPVELHEDAGVPTGMDLNGINKTAPDIYYVIYDEYGGYGNLKTFFDYDNSGFYHALIERGFNVSWESRNDESIETIFNVPNLLNLDYVTTNMNYAQSEKMMKNPYLFRLLKGMGYELYTCSSSPFLDESSSLMTFSNIPVYSNTIGYQMIKNGIFYECFNMLENRNKGSVNGSPAQIREALTFFENLSGIKNENPKLCVGYFLLPHSPYLIDANGNDVPVEHWAKNGVEGSKYYIEYLKWGNNRILEMVDHILKQDSNAIIVFQSDHGARPYEWYPGNYNGPDIWWENDILNCVYYGGEQFDVEGLSGINTLRMVLNKTFGTQFEMLETVFHQYP